MTSADIDGVEDDTKLDEEDKQIDELDDDVEQTNLFVGSFLFITVFLCMFGCSSIRGMKGTWCSCEWNGAGCPRSRVARFGFSRLTSVVRVQRCRM